MVESIRKNIKYQLEISIICMIIIFFLFRTAIPFFKYPFVLLFSGFVVYSVFKFRRHLVSDLKVFIKEFWLLFLLGFILVASFLISNKLYLSVFKDVINTFILILILFFMRLFIVTKSDLKLFSRILIDLIILFALVISVILLGNYFNIFSNENAFLTTDVSGNTITGNQSIDNTFSLLPLFFGIFGIFYLLLSPVSNLKKVIFNILLVIYTAGIFFSGSRRGFILLLIISISIWIIQIVSLIVKKPSIKSFARITIYYILSLLIFSCSFYLFTFKTNFLFKTKTVEFIGSRNVSATKQRVAFSTHKYLSIFNIKTSYDEYFNTLWSASLDFKDQNPSFDPKNPESIWGNRIHKTVFPLTGKNVEIVPEGTLGYFMDRTCNADTWNNNAYSYTLICKGSVNDNDVVKSSVYCYVSEDFDGKWAILYSSEAAKGECVYDLNKKGTWQKLNINLSCTKGIVYVHLYFSKFGSKDFSSLKGYVIFAYPTVEIITSKNAASSFLPHNQDKMHSSDMAMYSHISESNRMGSLVKMGNGENHLTYLSSICFGLQIFFEKISKIQNSDKDPIRRWASKFISEDTTYYDHKKELIVDTISNNFIGPRAMRWQYAFVIFSNEYNLKQKVFGGGFNFLNWYGYYFDKDKKISDYPHNPFLSVLLYSGIFGLIIYVIFMYKVFYYYFKYCMEYKILTAFFIITFFFSFFSAGSPFDPPVMGFFGLLPFLIHTVHKGEQSKSRGIEDME